MASLTLAFKREEQKSRSIVRFTNRYSVANVAGSVNSLAL
jgi:hypothetical protein